MFLCPFTAITGVQIPLGTPIKPKELPISGSSFRFFGVPGPFRAIAFSRRTGGVSAQMKRLRASSFKVKRNIRHAGCSGIYDQIPLGTPIIPRGHCICRCSFPALNAMFRALKISRHHACSFLINALVNAILITIAVILPRIFLVKG